MQYTEKVMDHFMNPHNVGVIENPSGYGKVGNPSCGDIMEIFIKVENDIITDVKFRTFGCASAIASSSVSTDLVKGKTIEEALKLTNKKVVEELGGLPPVKMHCSVLAEEAIQMAINDYLSKKEKAEEKEKLEAQQKEKNIIMEICWFLMMGRSLNYNFSAEPALGSLVQI